MKKGKKKNRKRSAASGKIKKIIDWNFVNEAGPGCHIARTDCPASSSWVLEWESVSAEDYEGLEVPDIAVDQEEQELVLCNLRPKESVVAYITIYDRVLRGRDGSILTPGSTTNDAGESKLCTTLIVLCPPLTFCHICAIEFPPGTDLNDLPLVSDVQVWNKHPNPDDQTDRTVGFPLQGGPFLCTQGEGGQLTHFFSGNLHAIDFRCPEGTPLLAAGDGTVVEAKDEHRLTGVAVLNLYEWNSILIRLDHDGKATDQKPLYVEYVHIATSSVKAGDHVSRGQVIGMSGSVGFSPEPHLHFAAYHSPEPTAPTVRVRFQGEKDAFLPIAGCYYNADGQVNAFD
eukprot:scaffold8374_cov175-Amphora_coffeaeformis.AAC.100